MKKIWIISEFYYPIVTSTGYYMTEIAEHLAKSDYDVYVICTDAKYNKVDKTKFIKEEIRNNVHIKRVKTFDINKNNFIKRTFRLLASSFSLLQLMNRNIRKGDELLCVTNPVFILLFLPIFSKLKGVKYRLLVHDIFPENLAAIKKIRKQSFFYRLLLKAFNYAYLHAETCISIGRDMSEIILQKTQGKANISLIPNWADTDVVFPLRKEQTILANKINIRSLIFQFAGNLGHAQGLDNIVTVITQLKRNDICFLFIGDGAKYQMINKLSEDQENVVLLGIQDRSTQNDFLNCCDIGIVTLSDGMYGLGVPSKSYNIMAAGKPILYIGDKTSEIALCIQEYEIGWIVELNNPQILYETMLSIISIPQEEIISIQKKSRWVAENVFSKSVVLSRYDKLFE